MGASGAVVRKDVSVITTNRGLQPSARDRFVQVASPACAIVSAGSRHDKKSRVSLGEHMSPSLCWWGGVGFRIISHPRRLVLPTSLVAWNLP